ncbi:MAG: sugar kinase [Hyphomonadaceae bacterium]|nr:sugar kinase [Hyphomonadaceae bacterium]
MTRLVCIGEGMLEISGPLMGAARFGYGGDALNTAIHLARLGEDVALLTALGRDPLSQSLRAAWGEEGLKSDLTLTHPSRQPGLYAIHVDDDGERRFQYWRAHSAAREMFALPEINAALDNAARAHALFLTGITLSLFDAGGRARLAGLAAAVRVRGGLVAFDPNYRPSLWPDADAARAAIEAFAPHVSLALPTLDDEALLWGDGAPEDAARRWMSWGADEVAVKLGARGSFVRARDGEEGFVAAPPAHVVDTTGAGDGFNAGYVSARLSGLSPLAAAARGHALAAEVVAAPGAIPPRRPPGRGA